jgi:alkanesulfonate monooxygenase SsuD/methylene tetrahydromethanopterin reductase-like flavin-dependent oxidoreductase (luciferase family)
VYLIIGKADSKSPTHDVCVQKNRRARDGSNVEDPMINFVLFHLMPYLHVDPAAVERNGSAWVTLSNSNYDPQKGAALYQDYLAQFELADELGWDILGLNEHHQTAYGMMPVPGVLAGCLARSTKRAKIAVLGRALPLVSNPLMVAEEFAIIDNLTKGRFIGGFVRGIGAEYHAMSANPSDSQARFLEAHDLIMQAWTRPGPFEFSGKYYRLRYVNPWPLPYQKPHPPIWIPTQGSAESIRFAAQHGYTYCQTLAPVEVIARYKKMFVEETEKAGREFRSDQVTWSCKIYLAETEAKARAEAGAHLESFFNTFFRMPPEMLLPPGYASLASMQALQNIKSGITAGGHTLDSLIEKGMVMCGTPRQIIERIEECHDRIGFGNLITHLQSGTLPNDLTVKNMYAFAEEVMPYFRKKFAKGERLAASVSA